MSDKRLQAARRTLERLEWEYSHARKFDRVTDAHATEQAIQEARWEVETCERIARTASVRAARRTVAVLNLVLVTVAVLTMAFSLGNVHRFAVGHGIHDPLGWLLAPAVDLALIGALSAEAFLSHHNVDTPRAVHALKWFAGTATLTLNSWADVATGSPGGVLATAVPPLALMLASEVAPALRRRAREAVDKARAKVAGPVPNTLATPVPQTVPHASESADTTAVPEAEQDRSEQTVERGETAHQSAIAPAVPDAPERPFRAASEQANQTPRKTVPKRVPNTARNTRQRKSDEAVLKELAALRLGAEEPLSLRSACTSIGVGAGRLKGLMDAHGLSLEPLPVPVVRPLRVVAGGEPE
jgi:Protein of unknown function (DUF2637)